MKRLQPMLLGLIALALTAASWAAPAEDRSWTMPVSELRPGMKGYGLTVFRGTAPERFNAEVLGVAHNEIGAGVDMIMVRLDHENLRDMGVIAGMSGSPIFMNDRVIGAVAYGFSFSKAAIAGVTPIEKMLEVYDRTPLQPPPRDVALGPAESLRVGEPVAIEPTLRFSPPEPVTVRRQDLPRSVWSLFESDQNEVRLEPLSMPVLVSSCSPQTAQLAERIFKPLGMTPIFAPVGSTAKAADGPSTIPLISGAAMGIPYILGDMFSGGIGTLTYTDGKKLVAFGHPAMSGRGPVELPFGPARIITTMPSLMSPFKMGEVMGIAGSIYEDRLPAVSGVLGKVPFMVPMTVRVVDEANKTERAYHFKIADNRLFTPRMAMMALVESCTAGDRVSGDLTATIHYRVRTDDGRVIEKENIATGSMAPASLAADLLSDMAPIYSNEFQVRSVREVTAEVHIRDGIQSGDLQSAFADRSIVKPGESVQISAYIRPWRKPQQRITATLRIPGTVPNGRYNIAVIDARQRELNEIVRAPGLYRARNFDDVFRILGIHFPPNRLYVLLANPEPGLTIDGSEFDSLPPSFQQTLIQLRDREKLTPTLGQILAETTVNLPFVFSGGQITQIEVDRRGGR